MLEVESSAGLARPLNIIVTEESEYYIADSFFDYVIAFDSLGRFLRRYPPLNSAGPSYLGGLLGVTEALVITYDYYARRVDFLSRRTERVLHSTSYEGRLTTGHVADDTLWVGLLDVDRGFVVGSVGLNGLPTQGTTLLATQVPVPIEYAENPFLSAVFDLVFVSAFGDSLVVGFNGLDLIYVATVNDGIADVLRVPALHRRGSDPRVIGQLTELSFARAFSSISALFGLQVHTDGRLTAVHFDQQVDGRLITAQVFVSLVDRRRRQACVDAQIQVSQLGQPVVTFKGDTLIVVDQVSATGSRAGDRALTRLRRFVVEDEGCNWISLRSISPERDKLL